MVDGHSHSKVVDNDWQWNSEVISEKGISQR